MAETTPHPYLEKHPGAIQDVEKAHVMALAADTYETNVVRQRNVAEHLINLLGTPVTPEEKQEFTMHNMKGSADDNRLARAERHMQYSRESRVVADQLAQEAADRHDKGQKILQDIS